jgi:hypothetical protein
MGPRVKIRSRALTISLPARALKLRGSEGLDDEGRSSVSHPWCLATSRCRFVDRTRPNWDLLRQFGCSQMQGWLFSPAVPASKLKQLLSEQAAAA